MSDLAQGNNRLRSRRRLDSGACIVFDEECRMVDPDDIQGRLERGAGLYAVDLVDFYAHVTLRAADLDGEQNRAQKGLRRLTPVLDAHSFVVAARDRVQVNVAYR